MKKRFTLIYGLLALLIFSASAQLSTDGLYTLQSNNLNKYMTNPGATETAMPMSETSGENTQFIIMENSVTAGKYNIITPDGLYLAASDGAMGVLIDNTEENRNSNTSGALVDILDQGSDLYHIESNPAGVFKRWNGRRGGGIEVGMGTSTISGYQWILTRIGELPAPSPTIAVIAPAEGDNILPEATVTLQASAAAEEGETLTSVEFLVNDVKVGDGVLNGEVYEFSWTAPATTGDYAITAKATSSAAAETTSAAINVLVANLPTSVTLTWPSEATTILPNKQVTLTAVATPTTGATITKVEFYQGTELLGEGTLNGEVYSLDTYAPEAGVYSITAKATDSEANTVSSSAVEVTASLTTNIESMYLNFESGDATTDWAWQPGNDVAGSAWMYESYDVSIARSAANSVLAVDFSGGTTGATKNLQFKTKGIDAKPAEGRFYIRIQFADDNNVAAPAAGATLWSSGLTPTPGTATANDDGTFKSRTWNKPASDMGANGTDVTIYPALRISPANTDGKIFFDDIVMYYDPNSSGTDGTAPTAPSNLAVSVSSATEIVLDWEEGMDVGIGIDSTYILRNTADEATPVLTNYVGYSPLGLPVGLSAVDNWTVVGVVPLGTKTFTDNSITDGDATTYYYTVVHKDYAYNYSEGITMNSGVATKVNKASKATFKCYGSKGTIQFTDLEIGQNLSIYSLSGAVVHSATINNSALTVNMPQGMYLIKVQGETKKVVVQ